MTTRYGIIGRLIYEPIAPQSMTYYDPVVANTDGSFHTRIHQLGMRLVVEERLSDLITTCKAAVHGGWTVRYESER